MHSLSTFTGTPVHLLIYPVIQSANHSSENHADTEQEFQLINTSNIKMGKTFLSVTLTMAWLLVTEELV